MIPSQQYKRDSGIYKLGIWEKTPSGNTKSLSKAAGFIKNKQNI